MPSLEQLDAPVVVRLLGREHREHLLALARLARVERLVAHVARVEAAEAALDDERVVGEVRLGLMMRPLKGVITREIEAGLDHYLAD